MDTWGAQKDFLQVHTVQYGWIHVKIRIAAVFELQNWSVKLSSLVAVLLLQFMIYVRSLERLGLALFAQKSLVRDSLHSERFWFGFPTRSSSTLILSAKLGQDISEKHGVRSSTYFDIDLQRINSSSSRFFCTENKHDVLIRDEAFKMECVYD